MAESASSSPRDVLATAITLLHRAIRSAWVGGIALALGLAGTAAWALSTNHIYRSEAIIVYERSVQAGAQGATPAEQPRQVAARVLDMLTSRKRLEEVIKQFNLYPKVVEQRNLVEAAQEMKNRVALSGRDGYALHVSFDGESRDVAKQVLDKLVKGVVDEFNSERLSDVEKTRGFLDAERKRADDDVKGKESKLAAFLSDHPHLAAETGGAAVGATIRAADRAVGSGGGAEVASLEMQAAQLEEAIAAASRPGAPVSADLSVDPGLLAERSRAQTEAAGAQANLVEKQAHFTNEHPDVKAAILRATNAEAQLKRMEALVAAARPAAAAGRDDEGGRTAALRRALAAVHSQIAAVRGRSSASKVEIPTGKSSVAIDTEWLRLNRDVAEARDRQGQLESKQFQAQLLATLVAGGQGGRLVVSDPPFKPLRPVAGGRLKIVMLGGAVSVMMALAAVALLAAFDDRLYGVRDVRRILDDEIVVVVPRLMIERAKPSDRSSDKAAKAKQTENGG